MQPGCLPGYVFCTGRLPIYPVVRYFACHVGPLPSCRMHGLPSGMHPAGPKRHRVTFCSSDNRHSCGCRSRRGSGGRSPGTHVLPVSDEEETRRRRHLNLSAGCRVLALHPALNTTGVLPTGVLPTGVLPTGVLPTGVLPKRTRPTVEQAVSSNIVLISC
jgi:hypothetical protein